ncbi:MAG: hypothetical protein RBR15_11800 [Sphaerochaeta sp.]|nr:hypothetical protein [Sphaerochaeta sp.]
MSRIDNSLKNMKFASIGFFLSYIFTFATRKIFLIFLSIEYLGLNGLFSNILSMLSLAELGIGTAICFSLYKPLALQETSKIQALMQLYRKAYTLIGSLVILVGLSCIPLLPLLLGDVPYIPYLNAIYALFVIDSGVSYFLSYKRTILVADQKKYIDTNFYYGFQIIKSLLQVAVLVLTGSYVFFLLIMLGTTITENLVIRRTINMLYPYLKDKEKKSLSQEEKTQIKKNVYALTFHKIGGAVVNGTDSILIVRFVGLASAGINANYAMVTTALKKVINILFSSLTASIGNLAVEKQAVGSKPFFDQLNFLTAWIFGFSAICLLTLFNPFISLWLGSEYLFDHKVVFVIVLNFYLAGMLMPIRTFSASMGLFWYDRYKPIFESLINLGFSIFLANRIGLVGVLIGTTISTVTTCFWFEPYVLFRFGFELPVRKYFFAYIRYTVITFIIGWITFKGVSYIPISNSLVAFLVSMVICALLPNLLYLLVYFRDSECIKNRKLVQRIIKRNTQA